MNSIIHLDRLITRWLLPLPPPAPATDPTQAAAAILASSPPGGSLSSTSPIASSSSSGYSRSVPPSPAACRLAVELPDVPLRRRATSGAPLSSSTTLVGGVARSQRVGGTPSDGESSAPEDGHPHYRRGSTKRPRPPPPLLSSSSSSSSWNPTTGPGPASSSSSSWLAVRVLGRLWSLLVAIALYFSSGKRGMLSFGMGAAAAGGRGRSSTGRRGARTGASRLPATAAPAATTTRAGKSSMPTEVEPRASSIATPSSSFATAAAAAAAASDDDDDEGTSSTVPPTPAVDDDADDELERPFAALRTEAVGLTSTTVAYLGSSPARPNPTFALLPPPPPSPEPVADDDVDEVEASPQPAIAEAVAVVTAEAAAVVAPRSRLLHNPLGQTTLLRPSARGGGSGVASSLSPPVSFYGGGSSAAAAVAAAGPRKTTPFHKPKTLILDLDETLIHSTSRPLAASSGGGGGAGGSGGFGRGWGRGASAGGRGRGEGHMVEVFLGGRSTVYHVYKRPYVDYFLKKVRTPLSPSLPPPVSSRRPLRTGQSLTLSSPPPLAPCFVRYRAGTRSSSLRPRCRSTPTPSSTGSTAAGASLPNGSSATYVSLPPSRR